MYRVTFTSSSGLCLGVEHASVMNKEIVSGLWAHDECNSTDVYYIGDGNYTLDTHVYHEPIHVNFKWIASE